jgi:hypothetical protein
MKRFPNFTVAISEARQQLRDLGYDVHGVRWQGVDVSTKPEMRTHELFNWSFSTSLLHENLDHYRRDIKPNLPWADRHFEEERVSGQPINSGETWKIWPHGHSANKFRTHGPDGTQFNHTYAERYWPKRAGMTERGRLSGKPFLDNLLPMDRYGIRYRYADLNDLIAVLTKDPQTRQAYMPIWFPEDGSHDDRKPCSLGYHFLMRAGYLHINYYIRSCDVIRHFQDDIYLTVRLLLWVLDRLRERDKAWKKVVPGSYSMFITSLHCFANDIQQLRDGTKTR